MEPSLTSPAALAQSPSLWAMPLALIQNQTPQRFPDGTASRATPDAGCEPVLLSLRVPPPSTRRELSAPIPTQPGSRPAIASHAVGPGFGSLPAGLCPAGIQANPTVSAIPTTAPATAADFAI